MSRITTPLARKRPFLWISMKSRLVRAARETSELHKWSPFIKSNPRYMVEIRHKTPYNQSINHISWTSHSRNIAVIVKVKFFIDSSIDSKQAHVICKLICEDSEYVEETSSTSYCSKPLGSVEKRRKKILQYKSVEKVIISGLETNKLMNTVIKLY